MNRSRATAVVLAPALSARGGAERVAVASASCLVSSGYRVVMAYPGPAVVLDELATYFDVDLRGVEPLVLPTVEHGLGGLEEFRIFSEQWRWSRLIAGQEPVVLFNCQTGSEMPAIARRNFYYVHFPHKTDASGMGTLRSFYMCLCRSFRAAALNRGRPFLNGYTILANSAFTACHVRLRWGRDAEVIYPPVPDFGPGDDVRHRRIMTAGRFQDHVPGHPHKRQDALIKAFATMSDLHEQGWELHIAGSVGSAAEFERLREMAAGLPVVFHADAPLEALTDLYRSSSLYWHAQGFEEPLDSRPEAQEHFGMTVGEALSAGLLPLVYETAGPAEVVRVLPWRTTWRSAEDLVRSTRELLDADESLTHDRRVRCMAVARGFARRAFDERLSALMEEEAA